MSILQSQVAIHEAGHAVGSYLLSWGSILSADIGLDAPAGYVRGGVLIQPTPNKYEMDSPQWRAAINRQIAFMLAGPCAQYLSEGLHVGDSDLAIRINSRNLKKSLQDSLNEVPPDQRAEQLDYPQAVSLAYLTYARSADAERVLMNRVHLLVQTFAIPLVWEGTVKLAHALIHGRSMLAQEVYTLLDRHIGADLTPADPHLPLIALLPGVGLKWRRIIYCK